MRDKIIEILQKQYDEENPWTTPYHRDTADEILGVFEGWLFTGTNECRTVEELSQKSQSAEEQEYAQGRGVGMKADAPYYIVDEAPDWNSDKWNDVHNHTDDCTCRHCHPEQWMLDSRNNWIRKIGSLGDEVI